VDILEYLIRHGASVHEIVCNRTLTALNINRKDYPSYSTIKFFDMLHSEFYSEFDAVDNERGYSALYSAVRSGGAAIVALDRLAKTGMNLKRIFEDGRTALHLAAELADGFEVLRHLYDVYGLDEVNRQDNRGWTALHYSVVSCSNYSAPDSCKKVRFLLEKGADPDIRGRDYWLGRLGTEVEDEKEVTPYDLSIEFGREVHTNFEKALSATGHTVREILEQELFYDAEE